VDYDGSNMKANRAWMQLFGYTSADLATLNVIDLYANPADRESLLRRISRTSVVADEVRFKKKDGTVFDCARTVAARRDRRGNIVAFQGIMRDITEQKRAYIELERLARYDTLTGLLNRRAFDSHLERECNRAERYGRSLCLLFMDVDDFKDYNDRYGHKEGDVVLAELGRLLRENLRASDTAFRFGGEEFVVLLPETGASGAVNCAERMRHLFGEVEFRPHGEEGDAEDHVHKTISVGVARFQPGIAPDELVRRADEAMYRAKRRGKDRTVLFE